MTTANGAPDEPGTIDARRATAADQPAVLALLADSLGWERDSTFADFFEWKHVQNPFGPSPAWVAVHNLSLIHISEPTRPY